MEYCYWEKRWLFWEVGMWSTEDQGYMLSFEDGILLLRETVIMLRSRNVIHRRPASFSCRIHVSASVIIPVLKKSITFWLNLVFIVPIRTIILYLFGRIFTSFIIRLAYLSCPPKGRLYFSNVVTVLYIAILMLHKNE